MNDIVLKCIDLPCDHIIGNVSYGCFILISQIMVLLPKAVACYLMKVVKVHILVKERTLE